MQKLLDLYGLTEKNYTVEKFGNGLINDTWLISNDEKYILQKLNKKVFIKPELIDENVHMIANFLRRYKTGYRFVTPLPSLSGKTMMLFENEYYRLIKFIPSKTYTVASNVSVAYEAAKQFGRFTKNLSGFNTNKLYEPIPHFHDIKLRYRQFSQAVKHGNKERIRQSEKLIHSLQRYKSIVDEYDKMLHHPSFKKRVTHHDTKISNVLFDEMNKGIAIIDLDTVMPGYFISDVGDMLRTYLSPAGEEEINYDLIETRNEYFKAIAEGYLSEMKDELFAEELNAFVYAGKFMIYMQALRFITDYLNNDVYYGAAYPLHNLNRAQNQFYLLERLTEKENLYTSMVEKFMYKF